MVKSGLRATAVPRPLGDDTSHSRIEYAESIEGGYGRKRQNAVVHQKEQVHSRGYTEWVYPGWGQRYFELEASSTRGTWIHNQLWDQMGAVEYKLLNGLYKRMEPIDLSFNLFNFLYELREVPDLVDPLKVVYKRMSAPPIGGVTGKIKGKAARRFVRNAINDIADTYLGATFGYVPTISDSFEIMSRVQKLGTSYKQITALRDKRTKFGFSVELGPKQLDAGRAVAPSAIDALNSENEVTLFIKSMKCTVSGTYWYKIPFLESFVFLSSALDNAGLHLDLATLWNAVPFSWLADWVLPIGDALAANRKSWTEIIPVVEGTISWKIVYDIRYPKLSSAIWAGRDYTDASPGWLSGSYYVRNPLPSTLEEYRYPPFRLFGWDSSNTGKRAGILAALATKLR